MTTVSSNISSSISIFSPDLRLLSSFLALEASMRLTGDIGSAPSSPWRQEAVPTPPGSGNLLHQGKLLRRDRTFLTWKWREFVLERNRLQYFSMKGTRKGEVSLTAGSTPITIRITDSLKPFGFVLFIKDEKLTLAATSDAERRRWVDVFCDVFHVSVEQENDRKTKPTYLPVPDASTPQATPKGSAHSNVSEMSEFSHSLSTNSDNARSFRYNRSVPQEVIPILESRMTYGPLKETFSHVTFPPSLANGDSLVGVGPIVRRLNFTDERVLAVGLYIDPSEAAPQLQPFHGRSLSSLNGDQRFYDHLIHHTTFRRSFVFTSRKRISKSVLQAVLRDEISPRIAGDADALDTFLSLIEKSLKKAESMVLRLEGGAHCEFRLRGHVYPPIASRSLCKCFQAMFFDVGSIQQDAKRGLIQRLPSLWGSEEPDAHDEIYGSLHMDEEDDDTDSDFDMDAPLLAGNDSDEDDSDDELMTEARRRSQSSRERRLSVKDKLDELDERTHELLRREGRSLVPHFGPMLDPVSHASFAGDLIVDRSTLLGTWSQRMTQEVEEQDQLHETHSQRFSVGLYVQPGEASENLLKYKGLSIGSIVQDPDFFRRFADGPFAKHLVFKVAGRMTLGHVLEHMISRLKPVKTEATDAPDTPVDGTVDHLHSIYLEHKLLELSPTDEVHVSIDSAGNCVLRLGRKTVAPAEAEEDEVEALAVAEEIQLPPPPFATLLQSLFYGYKRSNDECRAQLLQRLPSLLDLARDDLVHTYHDEIQVLKENYKRQKPENRVKAGYLALSFDKKRKMKKNEDGGKEEVMVTSRWSKRWCRLDGVTFSYYAHKRNRKARDVVDLRQCEIMEIDATNTNSELSRFVEDKKSGKEQASITFAIVKPNREILALRTESIYEGEEWIESLLDASKVSSLESGTDPSDDIEGQKRRKSSVVKPASGELAEEGGNTGWEEEEEDVEYKRGSLLLWLKEDVRHLIIFVSFVLLLRVITKRRTVEVGADLTDAV